MPAGFSVPLTNLVRGRACVRRNCAATRCRFLQVIVVKNISHLGTKAAQGEGTTINFRH
jgi:hypothetical protein